MSICKEKNVYIVDNLSLLVLFRIRRREKSPSIIFEKQSALASFFVPILCSKEKIIPFSIAKSGVPADHEVVECALAKISRSIFQEHEKFFREIARRELECVKKGVTERKERIIITKLLNFLLSTKKNIIFFSLSHRNCSHNVIVFSSTLYHLKSYLPYSLQHYTFFRGAVIGWSDVLKLVVKGVKLGAQLIKVRFKNEPQKKNQESTTESHLPLYFPHQGPEYGAIYFKDLYYSNKKGPEEYLHVEFSPPSKDVVSAYKKHSIKYEVITKTISRKNVIEAVKIFFLSKKKPFLIKVLSAGLCFYLRTKVTGYRHYLSSKKCNMKLALIGYDMLFDPVLSVCLQHNGFHVFAVQERMQAAGMESGNYLIFDSYLVQTECMKEFYEKNEMCEIQRIDVIKSYRTDYIKKNTLEMDELISSYKCTALVFDYHTDVNARENCNLIVNIDNNKLFYQDIISLSKNHPDCLFIIKSKYLAWMGFPEYSEIIRLIDRQANLMVNKEEADKITYALMAKSQIAIGKHTSALDEMRQIGRPIIIHDYGVNYQSGYGQLLTTDFYDPSLFVHSYSELEDSFCEIMQAVNSPDWTYPDLEYTSKKKVLDQVESVLAEFV